MARENKLFKELYSASINVFEEPCFSLRLELFGYTEKYNQFRKDIKYET